MSRFLRRRPLTGLAVTMAVLGLTVAACKPASLTSPNTPTQLTGQNPNEPGSFSGTLTLFGGGTAPADGATDVAVVVEVRDQNGNPAANLVPVTFRTSLGTIRASGTDPATAGGAVTVNSWGGQAGALLRSAIAGTATVTVAVADKFVQGLVNFDPTDSTDIITLAFRVGGSDVSTTQGTTPFLAGLVATVEDEDGTPLAGQDVRFRIVSDSAGSELTGPAKSKTDGSGEAINILRANQVGTVSLIAQLLDGEGNVVKESNQVVATITAESHQFQITLEWEEDGTNTTSTIAPDTLGMLATVIDASSGATLAGRRVRFRIVSDSATLDPAVLVQTFTVLTNGDGVASNALTVEEAGTVVTIEADLIASDGTHLATSNLITLEVE